MIAKITLSAFYRNITYKFLKITISIILIFILISECCNLTGIRFAFHRDWTSYRLRNKPITLPTHLWCTHASQRILYLFNCFHLDYRLSRKVYWPRESLRHASSHLWRNYMWVSINHDCNENVCCIAIQMKQR